MDALGPRAEEGRGKAAISLGESSSRHSRGFPNRITGPGVESGRSAERQKGKQGN